jgi:hypothetical protein
MRNEDRCAARAEQAAIGVRSRPEDDTMNRARQDTGRLTQRGPARSGRHRRRADVGHRDRRVGLRPTAITGARQWHPDGEERRRKEEGRCAGHALRQSERAEDRRVAITGLPLPCAQQGPRLRLPVGTECCCSSVATVDWRAPSALPPSCGRATGSSDLAVLVCSQRNERQADAELVEDLLDGGRSFDGHGRVGAQHPRRARRRRGNGLAPSSSTQRRAASARSRSAHTRIGARPISSRPRQPGDLKRVI